MKKSKLSLCVTLLLVLAMTFSLAGCSQTTAPNGGDKTLPNDTSTTDYPTVPTESPDLDASSDKNHTSYSPFGSVEVGSLISFGHFEQDNNVENGPEEIYWYVLDNTGSDIFVVSAQILARQGYDGYDPKNPDRDFLDTCWEECTLRSWLNGKFYEESFTDEEKSIINLSEVENAHLETKTSQDFKSSNNTQDYIFLLSLDELEQYLPNEYDRTCAATEYVLSSMSSTTSVIISWWLRTTTKGTFIMIVQSSGSPNGATALDISGVRPAMWLHIG